MFTPPLDVLNLSALEELQAILEDALLEIVQAFLDGLDDEVQAIAQACGDADANGLRRSAHSLKGSAANMGAIGLAQLSGQIEKLALHQDIATCRALLPELTQMATHTRQALQHHFQLAP